MSSVIFIYTFKFLRPIFRSCMVTTLTSEFNIENATFFVFSWNCRNLISDNFWNCGLYINCFFLFVNLKLNYSFSLQTSDIKGILYIKHLTGWYYDYDSNKEKIKQ